MSQPPPPSSAPSPPPPRGPRRVPAGVTPVEDPPYGEQVDLRARSAAAAFRVPFSVFDAGMVLFFYFLVQLVVGVLAAGVVLAAGGPPAGSTWLVIGTGAALVGFVAGIGWLRLRGRLSWRLMGPVRPGLVPVALGLGVGVAGTFVTYAVNGVLAMVAEPDVPVQQQVLIDALQGGWSFVVAASLAIVIAPVTEEVLFRGLLFQSLRRRVGMWAAAVVSSVLFTVIHVEIVLSQPLALVGLFTFGMILAYSFHRTGSLLVPIVAHATFNATSLGLVVMLERFGIVIG